MKSFTRKASAAVLFAAAMLTTPAHAQTEGASISALTTCAGAISAHANIDVVNYPRGASGEWAPVLGRILAQLNTMDGVEGMTGRYAASAARSYWSEQPAGERRTAAAQCRERFGG
jgi:hypothetical protein